MPLPKPSSLIQVHWDLEPDTNSPKDAEIILWARTALRSQDSLLEDPELCFLITTLEQIQDLNHRYRHQNKPTNVLSFPNPLAQTLGLTALGDIAICQPLVLEEAQAQNKSPQAHWAHLVIHGTLHLLGYDHTTPTEAELMENLEVELLSSLGFPNPYRPLSDKESMPL